MPAALVLRKLQHRFHNYRDNVAISCRTQILNSFSA